jgi:tRNA(Met) C34 N-acetyltransferase TmcA
MFYIGIGLLAISIIIVLAASEYANLVPLIFFASFLFIGITFIVLDMKSVKDQLVLVDSYKTNRIPIEYENPEDIKLIVNSISDEYIYIDNIVLLNQYENKSRYKVFVTTDTIYEIEGIK